LNDRQARSKRRTLGLEPGRNAKKSILPLVIGGKLQTHSVTEDLTLLASEQAVNAVK